MRPKLWLILILSFTVGTCCAFSVRHYYFEAKLRPVVALQPEETLRILVAKTDIAVNTEITAQETEFQDVPVSQLPSEFLTDFAKVYRRVPIYPIPAGCPICEDLLRPLQSDGQQATFIPAGSQMVTLQVAQIRQKEVNTPQHLPLDTFLQPGKRIDIRIVPKQEVQGKYAERKNEVLCQYQTFKDLQSEGELVLRNVPVQKITVPQSQHDVQHKNSVELLLEKTDIDKLSAAARRGLIRIVLNDTDTVNIAARKEVQEPSTSVSEPVQKTAPSQKDISDLLGALSAPQSDAKEQKKQIESEKQPENKLRNTSPDTTEQLHKALVRNEPPLKLPVENPQLENDIFMQTLLDAVQKQPERSEKISVENTVTPESLPSKRDGATIRFRSPQKIRQGFQQTNEVQDETAIHEPAPQPTRSPFELNSRLTAPQNGE